MKTLTIGLIGATSMDGPRIFLCHDDHVRWTGAIERVWAAFPVEGSRA
jgi:hypothetical protein